MMSDQIHQGMKQISWMLFMSYQQMLSPCVDACNIGNIYPSTVFPYQKQSFRKDS